MAIGKAKLPADMNFGIRKSANSVFQSATIDHNRTNNSSFVNASFNDYGATGQMSPIEVDSNQVRKSDRQTMIAKKNT